MTIKDTCKNKGWKVGTKITDGEEVWEITAIGKKGVLVYKDDYETFLTSWRADEYEVLRTCPLHENCLGAEKASKVPVIHTKK